MNDISKSVKHKLENFTIVTIAYEESPDLINTHDSLKTCLNFGAKWVLVVNKKLYKFNPGNNVKIIEGKDNGLYDAINIGLNEVQSEYFMLLHAGDRICNVNNLFKSLLLFKQDVDCVLGGAVIGKRKHVSLLWRPWMFKFYVQPPHLPILYRTSSTRGLRYDHNIETTSDFYYLKEFFLNYSSNYVHSKLTYVEMSQGGLTTSGLLSVIHVTQSFTKVEGIKPILYSPLRILLKLIIQ